MVQLADDWSGTIESFSLFLHTSVDLVVSLSYGVVLCLLVMVLNFLRSCVPAQVTDFQKIHQRSWQSAPYGRRQISLWSPRRQLRNLKKNAWNIDHRDAVSRRIAKGGGSSRKQVYCFLGLVLESDTMVRNRRSCGFDIWSIEWSNWWVATWWDWSWHIPALAIWLLQTDFFGTVGVRQRWRCPDDFVITVEWARPLHIFRQGNLRSASGFGLGLRLPSDLLSI